MFGALRNWRYTVLLTVLLVGCKPKEKEQVIANKVVEPEESLITGQIFIVTKGRANVVLGDEKIALLDEEDTRKYFNSNSLGWSNQLAEAQLKVDQAGKAFDAVYSEDLKKFISAKKYHDGRIATLDTSSPGWSESLDWSTKLEKKIKDLVELKYSSMEGLSLDKALEDQVSLWERINWPSPEFFFPSIAVTTTDSDGRFKFVVPATTNSFLLLAKTERQVGDDRENYWWAVKVYLSGKTTDVILSNDNKDSMGVWYFFQKPMQDYFIKYASSIDSVQFNKSLDGGYKEGWEKHWEQNAL